MVVAIISIILKVDICKKVIKDNSFYYIQELDFDFQDSKEIVYLSIVETNSPHYKRALRIS